ncbi:Rne/Rng family ribonuclease [Kribbella sp. NPDC048928]|uniref:Rne/Rng family ribonuclease n=1 Tax=Kribbella sp. NPDC048928 TaxID=3364111 RepID=UPI00371B9C6C
MLDNEPTTDAAGTAATAQPAASTRQRSTKAAAKKAPAAKKTTATRKRTVKKAAADATAVPTQSDDQVADPAPAPAKKAAAKKAVAKKAPAKKAAAKAPAKKTAKRATKKTADAIFPPASEPATEAGTAAGAESVAAPIAQPVVESASAAKKTTRKRTSKKAAAAPDLVSTDSPVTDGPVADASAATAETPAEAPARKTTSRRRTAKTTAGTADAGTTGQAASAQTGTSNAQAGAANTPAADVAAGGSADATGQASDSATAAPSARRSRRRPAAAAAVLFQAPTDAQQAAEAAAQAQAQAEAESTQSTPEPGTDEQPAGTRRRRSRRGRDAEPRDTDARSTDARSADARQAEAGAADNQPQAVSTSGTGVTVEVATDEEAAPTGRSSRRGNRSGNRAAARADGDAENRTDGQSGRKSDGQADNRTDAEADDAEAEVEAHSDGQGDDGDEGGEGTRRRRRRRGGRRRRKSGDADGADDSADETSDDEQDDDAEQDGRSDAADQDGTAQDGAAESGEDDEAGGSSRRRRRRRRRKGEDSGGAADDPDETVVRVREPRSKNTANEITAVEGSTRLEAKKQRRREGRAAGRRRAPIVTEAEFLARRESVERTMVIRSRDDLTQIAVSEDNVLVEHYVTTAEQTSLIGNVYLGRVQNVLPSMEAAFIDIGKGRNAVLYAGEVDWATLGGANGPRKIEQVLKSGQAVLVQVTKDPIGHKGARLTNQISLPGRYVVYVPRGGNGGISRKLPDTERNRLKTILKDIVPDEAGVIVRTAAEGASEEELTSDVSRLQAAWEDIEKKSKNGQAPQLLYGEPDLLIRVVRDLFTEDFAKLVISGDHAYDQVREYVEGVAPHLADRVEKWGGDGDVFANFRIDEQIKKALDRKVWLPSGGSLIIDRTEAMTVVDVNTGKFTGSGGNLEETVTKNNLEAAEEIVRQLRLRDIGGIIVIDFIDMVLESNRDLVLRRLVECLGRDRTKHQVAEVTSLGLVQMTRKRIGTGLLEAFSENCDHCGGRGLILHDEPKESRRKDGRNGQNGGGSNANGNGNGNGQQNGHDQGKSGQAEEGGRKSSRRRRGKGRGDDEQVAEAEASPANGDAAQKLAQIAAASVKKDDGTAEGTPEPTGYPVAAGADEHVSPEATGFPAPDATPEPATAAAEAADGNEAASGAEAAQNGASKSTRRRRSSRSRSKTATEGDGSEASELVTTGS